MTIHCQPQESLEETRYPRIFSVARIVFFIINVTGGILLFTSAIIAFVESFVGVGSPFALLGGIMLLGPCAAFTVAEWVSFYRKNRYVERILVWIMFVLAAFTVFGVVANVGEALLPAKPDRSTASLEFMIWFVVIGMTIALYFGSCGLFRVRRMRSE